MFNKIILDEDIDTGGDTLGTSMYETLESDLYDFTIKLAYGTKGNDGASALNLVLETEEGKELKSSLWVDTGDALGNVPYTITATGTRKVKPGYVLANDLCQMTVGKKLHEMVAKDVTLLLYDFLQKGEVDTPVKSLEELIGKQITAGVIKQIDNKKKKIGDDWVRLPEIKEKNIIKKFFHFPTGLTVTEAEAGKTEADFKETWAKKFKGKTMDFSKEVATKGTGDGTNTAPEAREGKGLFGKKA